MSRWFSRLAILMVTLVALPVASLFLACGPVRAATTYYVSPGGSNGNPGTLESPWATPGYGSRQLSAGDTLIILGGRYVLSEFDADIVTPTSGSPGEWVTIRGEEGNRPVLAGRDNLYSGLQVSGRSYLRIENLEITSDNGAPFRTGIAAHDGPVDHVVLKDLYIHHIDAMGIDIADVNDFQILDSRMEYCGYAAVGGPAGQSGGCRNVLIDNCTLSFSGHYYQGQSVLDFDNRPDGFGIEPSEGPIEIRDTVVERNCGDGLDSKSANTYIHECLVLNNYGDGVKLWDHDSKVANTLIYGTGAENQIPTPWVGLTMGDTDTPNARFDVINVTIDDNQERSHYPITIQYGSDNPIDVYMRSTTVTDGHGVAWFGDSVNLVSDHNNFYMPDRVDQVYANGRNYTSAQIQAGELGADNLSCDPLFQAPAEWGSDGVYELRTDSSLVDAGSDVDAPGRDLSGRSRPQGDGYDIGAYEWGAEDPPDPDPEPDPDPDPDPGPGPEPAAASTWYLAEGSTSWGFSTLINLMNPNPFALDVRVTYMPEGAANVVKGVRLPAASQTTLNPADVLGKKDFSTRVECVDRGNSIAVDRRMTWTGAHASSEEGHSSLGVTCTAKRWYLPEGSSRWGFETWLLVQNPNPTDAVITVKYMTEASGVRAFEKKVAARSRATFNMADDIGPQDSSILVESDSGVIAERAMYRNGRREGHDSIGATSASTDYYLSEGCTGYGFTTFILVQNPGTRKAEVQLTYMTGAGPVPAQPFVMEPGTRKTVNVNATASLIHPSFSTRVRSSVPIVAERAMYWDGGAGEACHDSIGSTCPHLAYWLPDGDSAGGYETFTLVQNPGKTDVVVEISYLRPEGKGNVTFSDTVKAESRNTYDMGDKLRGKAAVLVRSVTAGGQIIVERAMYWNDRGAGTDTVGGCSD